MAPAGHGPHAQFMGLGMQFMTTVVPEVVSGGGQVVPGAQVPPELEPHPYSATFTHW
jgi:Flp pilus assembly protein CpaB